MKIVLLNDNYTTLGGAEQYFFELKKRLQSQPGLTVYSIGFGAKAMQGEDYQVFKKSHSKLGTLFWRIMPQPLLYFRLRKLLKKIQPDIIHLHNIKQYSLTVLATLKPYAVIQTMHDYGQICPISYNLHKNQERCQTGLRLKCWRQHRLKFDPIGYAALTASFLLTKWLLKRTIKLFFAPSPQLVNYLHLNHFTPAKLILPFQNLPATYRFDDINPYHFLFVGNLVAGKGIDVLLDEFVIAQQQCPQLKLTIVGAGSKQDDLRRKINALGLSQHIQLTGWQTELQPFYASCAALIFPSIWMESFGLVITEAMGHARPVIGSDHDTTKWLVDDNKTGLIFNPQRKGDLAEKMLQLAGNSDLIEKYGQAGRHKVEQMIDNDKLIKDILTHYQTIAN